MQYTTSVTPPPASQASWSSANGRPRTGTSALGMVSVTGRIRVPSPPARIRHCVKKSGTSGHDGRAVVVEREAHLTQAFEGHGVPQGGPLGRVEQQEPAGAGAHQLAADGPVLEAEVVPAVDL